MIKDMRKQPRFRTINNEGRQTGRNSRIRSRRLEKFTGQDRALAKQLDDICSSVSGREIENTVQLRTILSKIERGAESLGCRFKLALMDGFNGSPHYDEYTVDEFCIKAKRYLPADDDTFVEVMFVDGEPGDQYMLVWTDDDHEEITEFAQFLFDAPSDGRIGL
jgi:hypothetical protein